MTTYAQVSGGVIIAEGGFPGDESIPEAQKRAAGYWSVVTAVRPNDTPTLTYTRNLSLVGGIPTESWVQRAKTGAETTADTQAANEATIRAALNSAISANLTFIALAAPTTAQVTAQVKALSTQVDRLIRIDLRVLDATT